MKKQLLPISLNGTPPAGESIREWHQIVMRGDSPLSVGERELIAAFTSGLNACALCVGVHSMIAESFGFDDQVLEALVEDIEAAPVDDRLKPIFQYAKKLTLEPSKLVESDADAVFSAGWDEQTLHDAINVVCMFNFMNRLVLGHGGTQGDIQPYFQDSAQQLTERGYYTDHLAE